MSEITLETIAHQFAVMAAGFDVHPSFKKFATEPTDNGGPHAEQRGSTLAYVVTERGQELERRETQTPDQLLYWFMSDVCREAASRYEAQHRQPGVDSRRLRFRKHVELLTQLRTEWGQHQQQAYDQVLSRHPFDDTR